MRILLLNDDHPLRGGNSVSTIVGQLHRSYQEHGHDVLTITSHRSEQSPEIIREPGIVSLPISYRKSLRHYHVLGTPKVSSMLWKEIDAFNPDAVHAHNVHQYITYASLQLAREKTAKVVLTCHDMMTVAYGRLSTQRYLQSGGTDVSVSAWDNLRKAGLQWNPLRNLRIRSILKKNVKAVVAVSHALKTALHTNGIPHLQVIHNGIDLNDWTCDRTATADFRLKHDLSSRAVILFGGRLSEEKGAAEVLRAVSLLRHDMPSVLLLVLGDAKKWYGLARQAGIKDKLIKNVQTLGWLAGPERLAAFCACDVVTTPSLCLDTFNLMNAEAMAVSKPVVGTIFGGTPEVVAHEETGYVCDPRDTPTYAGYLKDLLAHADKAATFGKAGRKRVEEQFTLKKMTEQYLQLFSE